MHSLHSLRGKEVVPMDKWMREQLKAYAAELLAEQERARKRSEEVPSDSSSAQYEKGAAKGLERAHKWLMERFGKALKE